MPLYQCQPPTGYKDTADAWTNTGALVNRMNFALQLSSGRMQGVRIRVDGVDGVDSAEASMVQTVLGDDVSAATSATIARATTAPQMMALALGSPEFQKR
jgi:uncharacterized protein (DUF1800 family)